MISLILLLVAGGGELADVFSIDLRTLSGDITTGKTHNLLYEFSFRYFKAST